VLKPSAYAPRTSALLVRMIRECFDQEYVAVVRGGREENTCLLEEHFDYIFFTGSQHVGKEVMCKASRRLTPVTLELGGKSPCIVERTADIRLAARRIVFGKFLNCGQTCVAPDYIYCDRRVKDKLIRELKKQLQKQYGKDPLNNKEYGRIVNAKHFERLQGLIDEDKVIYGGASDRDSLRIEPTLMDNITFSDAVMQEEIFGPLLPIVVYDTLDEAIRNIRVLAHPLALYIFTNKKEAARRVIVACGFGGGCINDTLIHLATSALPFGGVGESGMGSYHGKAGFDTFTHYKSIVDKKTWLDLPMRYHPYRKYYDRLLRFFLK
jgi:aldehyde dehydrogenase (NAD+)